MANYDNSSGNNIEQNYPVAFNSPSHVKNEKKGS